MGWTNESINSGYTVVNGSLSGTASAKLACWMEYKVISQSITNNTSKIRFFVYLATANASSYFLYSNNHTGDTRGTLVVTADGTTVYTRTERGFATGKVPTRSNHTTQYSTPYSSADGKNYLTILTDNNSSEATAYGECTVHHNADGTGSVKLAWTSNCSFASSIGIVTGSVTIALPTIPRASSVSVGSITLGSASTIKISRASSSFTHTLRAKFGSRSETTIATKTSSASVSWTPALAEANSAPNSTTASGTLYCDTYSGSTLIGTKSISVSAAIPSSVVPTCTYTMTEAVSGLAEQFSAYIQNKSKIRFTATPAGAYGSTISSVTVTLDGQTFTSTSFTTDFLTKSGSQTVKIVVKDSRGRTTTVNGSYTVLAYSAPVISGLSVFRCNASGVASHTGTYYSVTVSVTIKSLNSRNTASVMFQHKKKTETSHTTSKTVSDSYTVSGTHICGGSISNQYAYDIRIAATDYFGSTYAYADISTADTILSIRNNGLGMAIGKISEQNKFEVGWESEFHEDVTFNGDVNFSSLGWLLDLVYPVGSIRMTTSTTGATTFMGGTWVLWGSGRVPIGVNSQDTDFSTVEKTGGAKTVTLATGNLPSHSHTLSSGTVTITSGGGAHTHTASKGSYKVGSGSGSTYKYFTNGGTTEPQSIASSGSHSHTASLSGSTGTAGSGMAVNKLPPYITCYMYKRTA